MSRKLAIGLAAAAAVLVFGGGAALFLFRDALFYRVPAPDPGRMAALEAEIDSLEASFEGRAAADSVLAWAEAEEGEAILALRTGFVQEIATWAARTYLDDVHLHLAPDVPVEEGDEVRTKIGPISAYAGRWRVRVTIRSVEATLSADSIALAVEDDDRMAAALAIGVSAAAGDADIDFYWDAATLASVVCRDFEVHETFGGVVDPFTYRVSGAFRFEAGPDGILAIPDFDRPRLRVRPRPTSESWSRVSALLDRQNNIFRCGLALSPDSMMEKLERLLGRGFEFRLPSVLFRPIRLPARFADRVTIRDRTIELGSEPVHLHLTPHAIWYGSNLLVGAPTESAAEAGS